MIPRIPWPAGRRRRVLLAAAVVAAVVRVALPFVLRPLVASQASAALGTRVTIGDVDLALLRGGVALEDVAVWPPEGATVDAAPRPWIAWKRLAIAARVVPLLWKTVRLRRVEIDAPRVGLDRLVGGGLNLAALGASQPAAPAAVPPPAAPSGWAFGIDHLVLRHGALRYRDATVPELEPIEVVLDDVLLDDLALEPDVYGRPARARLGLAVGNGRLGFEARVSVRPGAMTVDATLSARRLPVHDVRFFVPGVGWSDLRGELGARLRYRLDPGVRDTLEGVVVLRDVGVRVPGLDRPALAWRRLAVELAPVDLAARRAVIAAVRLDGAEVVVRPREERVLPVAPALSGGAEPAGPDEGPAWSWAVASVTAPDALLHVVAPGAAADLRVALAATTLASGGDAPAAITLEVGMGDGRVALEGTARMAPPGLAGRVRVDALPLAPLADIAGVLPPGVFQTGRLDADLAIALGSQAQPAGDLRIAGSVTVVEPWLATPDAREFALGARAIDLAIDEIRIPGAPAGVAPRVALARLDLAQPFVQLTRRDAGIVLPLAPREAPPAPPPSAAPAAALSVGRLAVRGGRVLVTDRTVTPFFSGTIEPLEIEAAQLRWPDLAAGSLRLAATSAGQGRVDVFGALASGRGWLDVSTKGFLLPPFNPYVSAATPYSITRGRLTLSTKAAIAPARTQVDSGIVLHRLDVASRGGESLFQEQFGIPLSMALALLRDVKGDIVLDVPLAIDAEGTRVGLGTVIGGALRHALVNALASPLKLAGAVFLGGDGGAAPPAPVPFLAGRDAPGPGADERVAQLAALLASRPGLAVTLAASPASTDVRWLAEQAVREALAAPQGVVGGLRNLPERGVRNRVLAALDARGRGEEGPLEAADAAQLERWLHERPPVGADRVQALLAGRIARVAALLAERHGVPARQVVRGEPATAAADGPPGVQVILGTAQ